MKKLILFAFIILFGSGLNAQSKKGYVYLKNGSIIKGRFQYSDDFEKIKVESGRNIWIFNTSEIDSVSGRRTDFTGGIQSFFSNCVFYRTEVGFLAGNPDNDRSAPFSFSGSLNYNFNPHFSAGAGAGAEFFNETYLPVFVNLEYRFRNLPSTPYLFVKSGYQVPLEDSRQVYQYYLPEYSSIWPPPPYSQDQLDAKGGILVNPGIGYMHMFSQGFGISLATGYQFHRLHYKGDEENGLDVDFNRLSIKLGIIFR